MSPEKTFESGAAISATLCLVAESLDAIRGQDYRISTIGSYSRDHTDPDPWYGKVYEDWEIFSVAASSPLNLRAVLSREGQVRLYGPGGTPDQAYQIKEAGLMREGAPGYGYVNRIKAIADTFYVCGQGRQVYRFAPGAIQPLDGGRWINMAGAMRQPLPEEDPPKDAGEDFNRWMDKYDDVDFADIDGSAQDDLYVVGDAQCWHYNGTRWHILTLPTDEYLNAVKVLNAEHVLLLGHNGTLLLGNARAGFRDLSAVEDNQNFTSAEFFDGKLFLASNLGMFVYDARAQRILPYQTDLTPDLQDTHILEAKDGVLWSFGYKDLAWFDGKAWTRIDHPDNLPIR